MDFPNCGNELAIFVQTRKIFPAQQDLHFQWKKFKLVPRFATMHSYARLQREWVINQF